MRTRLLAAVLSILISCAPGVLGQKSEQPSGDVQSEPQRNQPERFNISFPGGTAAELVVVIEQAIGSSINVLVPPELAGVVFPPVKLSSVDLPTLFKALDYSMNDRDVQWATMNNVTVLVARRPTLETAVFFVGHLLTRFTVEDVTTAVQAAWDLDKADAKSTLKYHENTQLLIVRGPKDQLVLMKDILAELSRAVEVQPDTPVSRNPIRSRQP